MGRIKITSYVFKPKIEGRSPKETKESIQREFFKNNMAVVFSVHGQVHGHYTSEFITRTLKFPLLKDYLLIHVDCTDVKVEFLNELFMASRDRLKEGEESRALRHKLADVLLNGRLKRIYDKRKDSITVEGRDAAELLKGFARNLPFQSELIRLLGQTFKLENRRDGSAPDSRKKHKKSRKKPTREEQLFLPQRFPSYFKIQVKQNGGIPVVQVPHGAQRTIKFSTDVEDDYFDRVSEPGELRIAVLDIEPNTDTDGTGPGLPRRPLTPLNVVKSSPDRGTIRVTVNPTEDVGVGTAIKMRAELTAPEGSFEEFFLIKITDPEKKQARKDDGKDEPEDTLGLPKLVLVSRDGDKGDMSWRQLEEQGIDINHDVVMYPLVEGDILSTIYINMDATIFLNHRSKLATEEAISIAERRYISAVYFHTLFLYMITRNRKYEIVRRADGENQQVDLTEYLRDLFQSYYAEFLLNFEVQQLVAALE